MTGQKADSLTETCAAWTATGDRCRKPAMRDDSGVCWIHALSVEERKEHSRKMSKARQHKQRVESDASESRIGIVPGVSLDQILRACTQALGATFDHDGSPDHGARLTACAILLHVFPRSLRTTPEQASALLHQLLGDTKHEALADTEARARLKAQRAEWFELSRRVSPLCELYVEELPSWMLGPGEKLTDVLREEAPDLTGHKVADIPSRTHALVTAPNGAEALVQRDTPRLMV